MAAFKLGQLLINAGLITQEQLKNALQAQRLYGGKLGTNLIELGCISDKDLVELLGKQLQMQVASADEFEDIPASAIKTVPKEFAIAHGVIPLRLDTRLRIAISEPSVLAELNQIGFRISKGIQVVIAPEIWITAALERYYGHQRETRYISLESSDVSSEFEIVLDNSDLVNAKQEVEKVYENELPEVSFKKYIHKLIEAQSAKDVFSALFEFFSTFFARMAIYGIKGNHIQGLLLHGFPIHNRIFSELAFEYDKSTFLKPIAESKKPYSGVLPKNATEMVLFEPLGIANGYKVGASPIVYHDKTVALFLAFVREDFTFPKPQAGQLVSDAISKAGLALEYLTIKKKLLSTSLLTR